MKKPILYLLAVLVVLSGGLLWNGRACAAETRAVQPRHEERRGGYSKDSWTVFYRGKAVPGASPSTFRIPERR